MYISSSLWKIIYRKRVNYSSLLWITDNIQGNSSLQPSNDFHRNDSSSRYINFSLAFVTLIQGTKFPRKSSRFPSDRKVSTIGVAQVRVELRLVHEASRSANIMRTQIPESFIQNGHKIRTVAHSEERRLSQIWRTWIGETVERKRAEGWPKNPSTKLVIRWGSHEPLSRIQSRLAFLP